jgi:hypothetical protein
MQSWPLPLSPLLAREQFPHSPRRALLKHFRVNAQRVARQFAEEMAEWPSAELGTVDIIAMML